MCGALRSQKIALVSASTRVTNHVGAKNWSGIFCKSNKYSELTPSPKRCFIKILYLFFNPELGSEHWNSISPKHMKLTAHLYSFRQLGRCEVTSLLIWCNFNYQSAYLCQYSKHFPYILLKLSPSFMSSSKNLAFIHVEWCMVVNRN